jgi:SPP1 family predicted phage head-tail adaptor
MPAVGAGSLRHKGQLQAQTVTQNPVTGEEQVVWTTIAEPWAEIVPMSAREVRGRIVIRYRGDVDATMRFLYRGKYYAILGALPDAESGLEHITLMTAEGVRLDQ